MVETRDRGIVVVDGSSSVICESGQRAILTLVRSRLFIKESGPRASQPALARQLLAETYQGTVDPGDTTSCVGFSGRLTWRCGESEDVTKESRRCEKMKTAESSTW